MRYIFLLIVIVLAHSATFAQRSDVDSLKQLLSWNKSDSLRFALMLQIGEKYFYNNEDSAIAYIKPAGAIAARKGNPVWKAHATFAQLCYSYVESDFVATLNLCLQNIHEYAQYQDPYVLALTTHFMATLHGSNGYPEKAIAYEQKAIALLDTLHYTNALYRVHFFNSKEKVLTGAYAILSFNYLSLHKRDSALWAAKRAYEIDVQGQINWNWPVRVLAFAFQSAGQTDTALSLYKMAVPMAIKESILKDIVDSYNSITELYKEREQTDSAILYGRKALSLEKEIKYHGALEAALLLSEIYESQHRSDSALYYYKYAAATKDSIDSRSKEQQVQSILFKEELREREQRQQALLQRSQYRNQIRVFFALGIAAVLLSIALILWRNNRQKQKANALLQRKNTQIEQTLTQLKTTQAQLIQSEKMASLGELTAGIAHEIQNPLNFVNNFSDVNNELVDELKSELARLGSLGAVGNMQSAVEIAENIKENGQKINHHGKRADAIVKGMLQHSRTSSGQKEPTDVNALIDEYVRLAYHGFRAKDKSFNAEIKTDLDSNVGKISLVPQDIGRVILNLINNAFYAVNEKAKLQAASYTRQVIIKTKRIDDKIEIRVTDNGNGIPQNILDKIFQPFFTTKPTGQGTGLGLSLAYDIIRAQGGEIKVDTKEGEGSEFTIQLPKT